MEFGQKLRTLREMKGYKQEALAKKLDMTAQGYGKIERNETDITLKKLEIIAKVLEVTIQDILSFDDRVKLIHNQTNTNNEKVIICHVYHEHDWIQQELADLTNRLAALEGK